MSDSVMFAEFHLGKLNRVPIRLPVIPGHVFVVRAFFVCVIDTVEIRVGTFVKPPSTHVT